MGIYGDDSLLLSQGYVLDPNYMGMGFGSYIKQADYDKKYGKPAPPPPPPPAPVAAPPPPPPPPPPPAPAPEPTPAPIGPAISAGGAIDQPTGGSIGEQLGGAVLNPPKYWVGGIDSYETKKKAANTGKMTTTQT